VANKFNPFRPDKMMPPGMFCGRFDELKFIDHCLLQTKGGNRLRTAASAFGTERTFRNIGITTALG
jgi:hypothetical protein